MGELVTSRDEIEIGGMQWQVTPQEELSPGQALRITCVENFSQDPKYPMSDRTVITKLEDGTVHVAFDSERNGSRYRGSHEFEPGSLRAIVDYVEPSNDDSEHPVRAPRKGWLRGLGSR
jgi:hypothetical protein